jgi:RNA polymerase sigma-70 factor (ECF subfamily)
MRRERDHSAARRRAASLEPLEGRAMGQATVRTEGAGRASRRDRDDGMGAPPAAVDFKSVHDKFRPKVLQYLTRLVGEWDAEDLTQSVMLKVSDGLPGFRGESCIATWIYRVATNAALDKLRSTKAQRAHVLLPIEGPADVEHDLEDLHGVVEAQAPSAEAVVMRAEMSACIRGFVDRLPENYQTVIALSDLEGFKLSEVAAILGVSLETVKIRLHRARARLRSDLEAGCDFYCDCGELACGPKPTVIKRPERPK